MKGSAHLGSLEHEVVEFRGPRADPEVFDGMLGSSPAIAGVKALLRRVAASPASTVLLTGETGTGKDLAASIIHRASQRAGGPFVNVTCSALTDTLVETELFGHERGAFTDARQRKTGLLEAAHRGTIFLDEIGELSPPSQAKLLRFLEEKAFRRLGGVADIQVDTRIIAATNRDLIQEVSAGRFREDLYYRLSAMPVVLPPLRQRVEDVPVLAEHFIALFNSRFRTAIEGCEPGLMDALREFAWPGNVRQLRNTIERAVLLGEGKLLTRTDFPGLSPTTTPVEAFDLPQGGLKLKELERRLLTQALERTNWNRTEAATLLGLTREQVRHRIEKFGLGRRPAAPDAGA